MSDNKLEKAIVEERFLAGSGPGGQNANKVATMVQLRIDVRALGLPRHAERRLRELAGSRLTQDDELLLMAREYRTREANRQAARERLSELIEQARHRPARRIPTRAGNGARTRRMHAKKQYSAKKPMRAEVPPT